MKTILTALVLAAIPALSSAACDWHDTAAMSCAEGTVFDADAQRCVPTTG